MREIHLKFLPEQMVWTMLGNRPVEKKIISVDIKIERSMKPKIEYTLETPGAIMTRLEEEVFETKEELKQSIFG